jgi:hypothetical protein
MHIERNLAWFDNEDEAIEVARQWAIEWIDARNDNLASTEADSSMWQATGCGVFPASGVD